MLRCRRLAAIVPIWLALAAPAPAQVVESQVRSWAENEIFEPDFIYAISCDPSPHLDPIEDGCACQTSGVYGSDEKCLGQRLYRFTNVPGDRLRSASFACDADACAFIPPAMPPDEALSIAETSYAQNFVDVSSMGYETDPNWIYNEAAARSFWADTLTLTTAVPDLSGVTLRAVFRVRGGWRNDACFVVRTLLYQQNLPLPRPISQAEFANADEVTSAYCLIDDPFELLFPPPDFTDYGAEDGAIDVEFPLEIPLTLPAEVSLSGELRAYSLFEDSFVSGPGNDGLEMIVVRLEVPAGVAIESAADALDAYNVPEPSALASAALALVALTGLRRR